VTSDPDGERGYGSGPADAFVLVTPLCNQTIIDGFPSAGVEVRQCGSVASTAVIVEIEGKKTTQSYLVWNIICGRVILFLTFYDVNIRYLLIV